MIPLYAARVCDLKPGDFVVVECGAFGHDGLIHPSALPLRSRTFTTAGARRNARFAIRSIATTLSKTSSECFR